MATYKLGLLKGDGIGPEIVDATIRILESFSTDGLLSKLELVELPMGYSAILEYGSAMPDVTKEALKTCDAWIMGPYDSLSYPDEVNQNRNPSGELRHEFDLYANIRPSFTIPGISSVIPEMDLVIVRENTEGFYPDRNMKAGRGEFMPTEDTSLCVGVFTRQAAERIARVAFELASKRRKKVTIVHKANVIRLSYGLFIEECRKVAQEYPDVQVDDYHVDAMTAHLVKRPKDFDVIVTTNMFGDILSDLTAALAGSLGIAPSLNSGNGVAMAQASHGSAPDIAGRGIANPTGIILSVTLLLEWLGEKHHDVSLIQMSQAIRDAVFSVYRDGISTPDLGGTASTSEFSTAVVGAIKRTSK
jgi:3-isopropylmalate dehydrogenase